MFSKRKKILLSTIAVSSFLIGCEKKEDNNTEVIEEYTVADDNKDYKEEQGDDNIKDDIAEENTVSSEKDSSANSNKTESTSTNMNTSQNKEDAIAKEEIKEDDGIVLVSNPVFTKSEITDDIKARMEGKSMKENDSISYDDLSYLTITHLDYNGNTVQGEMVVHKKLADEVLDIFREIYNAKFPIERMNLIDNYNAVDHTSMVNNNSSAFCYRTISGTNKVSNHGLGIAIDINPFYNPHVLKSSGTVNPPEASKYADRTLSAKGMIKKDDVAYKAFTSRGWTWGGNWNNPDYQHFEKKI